MPIDFKLPDIGEGTVEGEIVRWLVAEGDAVKEDQPMVEVMTDKANVEITSPTAGVILSIPWKVGDTVPVGSTLVVIGDGATVPTPSAPTPLPQDAGKVLATPAVRKAAREMGVDLASVVPSGPGGRVTREDLEAAAKPSAAPVPAAPAPAPAPRAQPAAAGPVERVPLRGLRKRIAEHMAHARQTAAHFTYVEEVDFTELGLLRAAVQAEAERRGAHITFLPFIVKAVVAGLKDFPLLNASLDDEAHEVVLKRYYNIGVAVAVSEGLIVPVVKGADAKGVVEIAKELAALSARARAGKSTPEDLSDGTFSITSLGKAGGLMATPILNWPEVAIMGVHEVKPRPVARDGLVVVRDVGHLSLSFDHRVVDGAVGAAFTQRVKAILEEPRVLVLGG